MTAAGAGGLRIGLVGAGSIAQTYARACADRPDVRIVAVADVRPDSAARLAEVLQAQAFSSHWALAAAVDLDAAIVCTPPASHETVAVTFLEQGVPVLCEKPLAIDVDSARRMLAAARRSNTVLTMASKFRFAEDVIRARSIVASGALGDLVTIDNAFCARVDMRQRWNADPRVSGGGVLIDNGTHSVDIFRYFLGALTEVHSVEGPRLQALGVEDTVRVFTRSAGGVLGSIDLSWSISKELDWYLNLVGSRGTLQVGWRASRYRQVGSPDGVVFGAGYDKAQAFRAKLANFVAAVRGEEAVLVTPEDALASVEVIQAAYASLRENRWTPVPGAGAVGVAAGHR